MNRKMTVRLVGVCCLAAGVTLMAQEGADASSKVQQLEKEMKQAQMNSDASWYEQHLADGYVEGYSWGDWATKADAIKQMQDKSIKFTKGEISELKVATFEPDVAIAHYKFTYDATFNGTHRARAVICSDTWVSQSGAWKLASDHCSHVEGK
ncbi:MAG: nuclear transport factor 2 family protein [Acidobacteriaceae bacterium]|nr:nuclear transport factor 2 family protein [Acidobacteriaceae bacterium]MBV9767793.1 nuclear transport factor 2 family protein [Acidobacteriaceae bacterium]